MRSAVMVWMCLMATATAAVAEELLLCGQIDEGARDYRAMTRRERMHIETAHFTDDVERLRRGRTGDLGGDIDYTLRHIPNHARALMAVSKLALRLQSERIPKMPYLAVCYFHRAVQFAPDDPQVRFAFGMYYLKRQNVTAARQQFDVAARYAGASGNLNYNLGLVYLELGDVEAAVVHARRAYAAGPQPGALADRLRKLGRWEGVG